MKPIEECKEEVAKLLHQGVKNGYISQVEMDEALKLTSWPQLQPILDQAQGIDPLDPAEELKQVRAEKPLMREDFNKEELERLKALAPEEYELLHGGACHGKLVKTIVTMDLAEKIAEHYGVKTVNVLTGFKFIGEVIGRLEDKSDYICGFEESYGFLTGSYVRDKDAVNAAFMICEMFAYYRTHNLSLLEKLNEIYREYGYCLNTLHSYEFPGSAGMEKMSQIMKFFHEGVNVFAGMPVLRTEDYSTGLNGLPSSDVLKFFTENCSVVIRPSGTEPKLKAYISVTAEDEAKAREIEASIKTDLEKRL